MKTIQLFYLETCPYCINGKKALAELTAENPAYQAIGIEWIEESRRPDIADKYDYYYVPAIYDGEKKLYEAHPSQNFAAIKDSFRAALDAALA